jgi:hypothetical protein
VFTVFFWWRCREFRLIQLIQRWTFTRSHTNNDSICHGFAIFFCPSFWGDRGAQTHC